MIKQILIISCIIFCIISILLYFFQRRLIYFPTRQTPELSKYNASDMSIVSLKTADNIVLKSWYKPSTNNSSTVLYLHGNGGHVGHRMAIVRQLLNAGIGVFLLEYRGYGGNDGSPSEQGFYEDGRAAVKFLHGKGIKNNQLVLYGESLGTGVATKLASENSICALILQSPFTSLASLARYHYPWIIIKPSDLFNSLAHIQKNSAPLLILHGKLDPIVPYKEGVAIYKQATHPKKMRSFDDKKHDDLWQAPYFYEEVIHFIQSNCFNN